MFKLTLALLTVLASPLLADTLRGTTELTTSTSQDYDARSVFTNPAALAYQTELNGATFLSSVAIGVNRTRNEDFSTALTYGNVGLGVEWLHPASGDYTRFTFGMGTAIGPMFYTGTRFSVSRLSDSLDFGLQFRPHKKFSLGAMVNGVYSSPIQFQLGATVRPVEWFELAGDIVTPSNRFFSRIDYQAGVMFEVVRGLKVRAGYHSTDKLQFGLQWNWENSSTYSVIQPGSDQRFFVSGAQFSTIPYRSLPLKPVALKKELDSTLKEEPETGNWFVSGRPGLVNVLSSLEDAESDSQVKNVSLSIEKFPLGLAAASEVFEALYRIRKAGKKVEVRLGQAGLPEYLIACAADKITLEPSGELRLVGLKRERVYARGTLDKLGVEPEFLAKGDYKSAPETLSRKDASPKNREASLDYLREANRLVALLLEKGRKISMADWNAITQHAVFSAEDAMKFKLIDAISTSADWDESLKKGFRVVGSLEERKEDLALTPRIAVVVAEGDILDKRVRFLSLAGQSQVTPDVISKKLETALADARTRAIVLRVSSPGGEILASHEIATAVEKANQKKPVVVSMGDSAASGGYFISAPANTVFAQPLTATGSIGVFLGKFSLKELYKKIDLTKELLSDAPHPGLYTEGRPWTAAERAIMQRRLNQYYDGFIRYVASKRPSLKKDEVEAAAQGRVWLGSQALDRKLTDKSGGLLDAVEFAAGKANLTRGQYEIVAMTSQAGFFNFFGSDGWVTQALGGADETPILSPEIARHLHWTLTSAKEPFLFYSPEASLEKD